MFLFQRAELTLNVLRGQVDAFLDQLREGSEEEIKPLLEDLRQAGILLRTASARPKAVEVKAPCRGNDVSGPIFEIQLSIVFMVSQ